MSIAREFTLPADVFAVDRLGLVLESQFSQYGLMSVRGFLWIVLNNLRAIAIATFLGIFSFGILGELLLMVPIGIIGYFAGNIGLAGEETFRYLTALVLPHAILETPAAIIAGGAILQLGMTVMSPPKASTLGESWIDALAEWARVSLGLVIPLIILAALLETYLTPRIAILLLTG
jgi:uncharacterized membrane protein SpoIIM required for sporulation